MKIKRILSAFLASAVVLGSMAIPAFAEDTTGTTNVAKVGNNEYATLQEAFDAAKTGDTVTLLDNITLEKQVNITNALNGLTFDGNNKTIATNWDYTASNGATVLCFGGDNKYVTGVTIKNLTLTGTARMGIFLHGGTSSVFENVTVKGDYYIGVNLYGTHGATMTNCTIETTCSKVNDRYVSAIWSNVAAANPLKLINSKVSCIAINTYTTANTLAPKIFVDKDSSATIHTFDDGTVSKNKLLCLSPTSEGDVTVKYIDSELGLEELTPVAKIGETGYATLQAALSKAENGNTITLVKDIDITNGDEKYGTYLSNDISVKLDLNGKKIHAANTVAGRMNFWKADLTLEDSSTDKTGEIYTTNIDTKNNCPVINLMSGATLTMNGGTIDTAQENPETNGNSAVGLYGDTVFTMNDGTINSGWFSVASNGQDKDGYRNVIININGGKIVSKGDYAIYAPARGNSVLTISNGYVCGYAGGVAIKTGTLNVTGGEIVSMGKSSTGDWKDGTGGLDNAAININASYGPIVANISGGKMLAGGNAIGVISTENDTTLNVTGGRFSDDSIGEYLDETKTTKKADDGLYDIVTREEKFGDVAILTGMTADDGNPLLTLFTGINYLDYKNVGFTVKIGKDTIDTPLTTTVYTSVKTDSKTYDTENFGSEYIFGANLVFDKAKYGDVSLFEITPFATAPNGKRIVGDATTVEFGTSYSGTPDPDPGDTP